MSSRLDGLSSTQAMFAVLPDAARRELQAELRDIADEVLKVQQQLVPVYNAATDKARKRKKVKPGLLKASLTIEEEVSRLRVLVGYPQLREKSGAWYARIMERGRKARTVTVHRLKAGGRAEWRQRVKDGRARLARKPKDLTSTDTMEVGAIAPRVHVHIEQRMATIIDSRLADFWDRTLNQAGA